MPLIYHVYNMYIPCIYLSVCDIPVIYQAYSWYILHCLYFVYTSDILYIYMVYTLDMYVYTWYIHSIYFVYKLYIHDIYIVYETPGTVNSREVQCLTGKAHELIFLNLRHSALQIRAKLPMTRATKATAKTIGGWKRE